jgi:hypothetical protein
MARGLGAAVTLALLLAVCGDDAVLDRLAAGEYARVVAVRSGDDVILDSGLEVRLAGLDVERRGDPGSGAAHPL